MGKESWGWLRFFGVGVGGWGRGNWRWDWIIFEKDEESQIYSSEVISIKEFKEVDDVRNRKYIENLSINNFMYNSQ